jgi:PEP-CTERM motif
MTVLTMKKSVASALALLALSLSPLAQAASADCEDIGVSADVCFTGLIIQPKKSPSFSDVSIGKFTLTSLSDLFGSFLTPGLTFSEVSLWQKGAQVSSDSDLTDGISFADIGAGKYNVRVSGLVTGPNSSGYKFGAYSGGFTVTAVPEPETYALFGAGLLAVFFMSRRRNNNA